MVKLPFLLLPCAVLSLALLLSGCQGGTTPQVESGTPPTPSPPSPGTTVTVPRDAFWAGEVLPGPGCQGRALSVQSRRVLDRELVTPGMRALSGAAANLEDGRMMALLPTRLPVEQARAALGRALGSVQLLPPDHFGYWVSLQATAAQATRLLSEGAVQYVEMERTFSTQGLAAPNDVNLTLQAAYFSLTGLDESWKYLNTGCASPVVAVIDSGWTGRVDGHQFNLVTPEAWFDAVKVQRGSAQPGVPGHAHGTQVASVISMVSNDTRPGSGVGNNLVKVLPINAMSPDGVFHASELARALEYAGGRTTGREGETIVNPFPAQVINLSVAEDAGSAALGEFLASYLERVAAAGVVTVVSSGNNGEVVQTGLARDPSVLVVGGVDATGAWWSRGNAGPGVVAAGPADRVGVLIDGVVDRASGTSMAAPWVAGQVALWMYANRQYRADSSWTNGLRGPALIAHLRDCFAAAGSNNGRRDDRLGYGVLDTAVMVAPGTACRR